jgi:hypothetical protein
VFKNLFKKIDGVLRVEDESSLPPEEDSFLI